MDAVRIIYIYIVNIYLFNIFCKTVVWIIHALINNLSQQGYVLFLIWICANTLFTYIYNKDICEYLHTYAYNYYFEIKCFLTARRIDPKYYMKRDNWRIEMHNHGLLVCYVSKYNTNQMRLLPWENECITIIICLHFSEWRKLGLVNAVVFKCKQ